MKRRWYIAAGIALAGLASLFLLRMSGSGADPDRAGSLALNGSMHRVHPTTVSGFRSAEGSGLSPLMNGGRSPQAQATFEAMREFQSASMPTLDRCLGPTPAPRVPRSIIITFQRVDEETKGGQARFVAKSLEPVPTAGKPVPPDSSVARCLRELEQQPLSLNADVGPEQQEFQQVLTLFLPSDDVVAANRH